MDGPYYTIRHEEEHQKELINDKRESVRARVRERSRESDAVTRNAVFIYMRNMKTRKRPEQTRCQIYCCYEMLFGVKTYSYSMWIDGGPSIHHSTHATMQFCSLSQIRASVAALPQSQVCELFRCNTTRCAHPTQHATYTLPHHHTCATENKKFDEHVKQMHDKRLATFL